MLDGSFAQTYNQSQIFSTTSFQFWVIVF
jgi:hypothetical protein